MKLKVCSKCNKYTLKNICSECEKETKDAHYKYRDRFVKNPSDFKTKSSAQKE